MASFDIVIVTNSAGELSAYVKPTVEELAKKIPEARIILVLTPCQYATGRELEEAKSFPGIYDVILPQEYKKWMLKKVSPAGITFDSKGLVLHMGGDYLHSFLISKKLKFKAMAYTQKSIQWQGSFSKILVPDERVKERLTRRGIPGEKIQIVGDLMVDSIPKTIDRAAGLEKWKLNPSNPIVSLLPGSRPFSTDYMVPFFMDVAKMMRKVNPEIQFLLISSPYIAEDDLKASLKGKGTIYSQGSFKYIQMDNGLRAQIINESRHEAIALSNIALTIPGTNTAEIAALGTPMIVVFPTDAPDNIPLEGIADWICRVPGLGMFLKRTIIKWIALRTKYFALPNIKTGREIVPEFKGHVNPKEVAAKALSCLKNQEWLAETGDEMKKIMGDRGAAEKIAGEVKMMMEKT